jgi:GTP-binding protein HflX
MPAEQDAQVEKVLKELEADGKPRLRVMNKIDLVPAAQREKLHDDASKVHVSAAKGTGISTLLERVDEMLQGDPLSRVKLRVPQKEGKALSLLEAKSRIYSRKYKGGLVELEVEAPESVLRKVREWVAV